MEPEFRKRAKRNDHWLSDGRFGIGLMMGIVSCLFGWLILDVLGSGLRSEDAKALVPALATAVVALISVIVSGIALREQRIMRQAGTDPVLVAHLSQLPDEPIILGLNVSNVGAGAAMNVFVAARPPKNAVSHRFIGQPFETAVLNGKQPIKVILQNERVTYELGTGPSLLGDDAIEVFEVELRYQDIEGSEYRSVHTVDVTEFLGRPANSPATTKIWRQLEKIEKTLSRKQA